MPTTAQARALLLRAETAEAELARALDEVTRLQSAPSVCHGCGEPMGQIYCSEACRPSPPISPAQGEKR